ncbi:MAG: hypothetical protein ACQEP7_06410 [bacterium]
MKHKIVSLLGKKRELQASGRGSQDQNHNPRPQIFNKNHQNISCQTGGIPDIVA